MRFKRSTILVFTVEMSGDDVRVEFHPSKPSPPSHRLWRVVVRRAGEQLALDWFAGVTEPPRAQDAAYYIEKHVVAPIVRTRLRHSDPHRRPSAHAGLLTTSPARSAP
jgi:hypothetical protein